MARENQGLQIALIIFVMLTIILGVTTFIFFRQYEEADLKAQANLKKTSEIRQAADALTGDNNRLKEIIGFAGSDTLPTIDEEFDEDMKKYAGTFPEDSRFYRQVLARLFEVITEKNVELASAKDEVQELKDKYEVREASKDPQIKQHLDAVAKAGEDLAAERRKFKGERDRITEDQTEIASQMQKARKDSAAAIAKIDAKLQETGSRLKKLAELNRRKSEKLDAIVKDTFEVPDGEIRWVNQRNGTVWINVGRADALERQVTFSVYPTDTTNLTNAGSKASIEVTQILGEHLAEARVIEDKVADPIMPGDKIHTPVWSRGEQKRFALAGFMDVDDDGSSDQHVVRNLITMNGGKVDCEVNEKGVRVGKMTIDTRYLVLGDPPTAKGQAQFIASYTRMIGDAERLGIQKIPLAELLGRMGWKKQTRVVRFGRGANPNDFRAKPPDGVPKVSTGSVSDVFKPRRPPRDGGRGAY